MKGGHDGGVGVARRAVRGGAEPGVPPREAGREGQGGAWLPRDTGRGGVEPRVLPKRGGESGVGPSLLFSPVRQAVS